VTEVAILLLFTSSFLLYSVKADVTKLEGFLTGKLNKKTPLVKQSVSSMLHTLLGKSPMKVFLDYPVDVVCWKILLKIGQEEVQGIKAIIKFMFVALQRVTFSGVIAFLYGM